MNVSLKPEKTAWQRQGRPPKEIPPEVVSVLMSTYGTGNVGVVTIGTQAERAEAMELIALMRKAASRMDGKRVAIQPPAPRISTEFRFKLVDKRGTRR